MGRIVREGVAAVLILGAVVVLPAAPSHAATTYTWYGTEAGGDGFTFTSPKNWRPEGVPANGDSAVIERRPSAPAHVNGVPSLSLEMLTVGIGTDLVGDGTLTVNTFVWNGGNLGVSVDAKQTMTVSGNVGVLGRAPSLPRIAITNRGAGTILGSGTVRLGYAELDNLGTLDLVGAAISGVGCCANPNRFINEGQLRAIASTIDLMRFELRPGGSISAGDLRLTRGDHRFWGGSIGGAATVTVDSSQVGFNGSTIRVDGNLRLSGSSTNLRGAGTLSGTGAVTWLDGIIYASLEIAPRVHFSGPGAKQINATPGYGGGTVTLNGDADLDVGVGNTVKIASAGGKTATLRNKKTLTLRTGGFTGLCGMAVLDNPGTIVADPGSAKAVGITEIGLTSSGKVQAKSGTLNVSSVSASCRAPAITGGSVELVGGAIAVLAGAPLSFSGGALTGTGTITGAVRNTGATVDPGGALIGTITVGKYAQAAGGKLKVQVKTLTSADRVVVTGAATLAGTLAVSKLGTATLGAGTIPVVTAAGRSGNFGTISGLSSLGSGWRVTTTANAVRLTK